MTSPGGMLTPGSRDESGNVVKQPTYGNPEGAYVSGGSGQSSITDLNGLDEPTAKARMRAPLQGTFAGMHGGFWGVINGVLGILQGAVNLVVGAVNIVVDGIKSIIGSIGSLFGATSRDTRAIDQARVAAENAIVDNLGDAVDQLDEIQRAGGAYMNYPKFKLSLGGKTPHVLPLSAPMTLQEGTAWVPPIAPLTHSSGHTYSNTEEDYAAMARASGYLELLEPGFWRIDFQAAVLQPSNYYAEPAEVWCYVTPASTRTFPMGAPGLDDNGNPLSSPNHYYCRSGVNGSRTTRSGDILAFGRSSAYVDQLETGWSGGNTISGTVFALLPSGGYKVSLSCSAWEHFSGGASTFVMATKVNSEALRDDIDALKTQFALSLPGNATPLELSDAAIVAMVADAAALEVAGVEVPDE